MVFIAELYYTDIYPGEDDEIDADADRGVQDYLRLDRRFVSK